MRFNSKEEAHNKHINEYRSDGYSKQMCTQNSHDYYRFTFVVENLLKGKPVLDVGCNGGTISAQLIDRFEVKAIDIVPELVKKALSRGVFAEVGIAEDLSRFQDESFGSVICTEVLEHLYDPEIAIKEACRVLIDGGHYIITVPSNQGDKLGDYHHQNLGKEQLYELFSKYFKKVEFWDIPYTKWFCHQNGIEETKSQWIGALSIK